MATTEPIRNKQQVKAITGYYLRRGQIRNHALIVMGIHTALRISDMLRLTWEDVYDFANNCPRREIFIVEKKTGKSKIIAVNQSVIGAITQLFNQINPAPNNFLFAHPSQNKAISRIQAYRILRAAAEKACVDVVVSCHSLRKTFGYHLLKKGISLAIIMDIYNHSSYAITRRYLGVTQDDKNSAYLELKYGT